MVSVTWAFQLAEVAVRVRDVPLGWMPAPRPEKYRPPHPIGAEMGVAMLRQVPVVALAGAVVAARPRVAPSAAAVARAASRLVVRTGAPCCHWCPPGHWLDAHPGWLVYAGGARPGAAKRPDRAPAG